MLIVIYFIGLVIISVYVKCFNIDVRIYGTLLIQKQTRYVIIIIIKKQKLVTHVAPHASAVSLLKRAENSAI